MKHMKKLSVLLLALTMSVSALSMTACGNEPKPTEQQTTAPAEKTVLGTVLKESTASRVVIVANETNETKSVFDAMKGWKEEKELDFTYSDSEFGAYIHTVNGYNPNAEKNEYWAVYTSLTKYKDVDYSSTEWGSVDYDGKKLGSANFGVSGLPLVAGTTYILTIGSY